MFDPIQPKNRVPSDIRDLLQQLEDVVFVSQGSVGESCRLCGGEDYSTTPGQDFPRQFEHHPNCPMEMVRGILI